MSLWGSFSFEPPHKVLILKTKAVSPPSSSLPNYVTALCVLELIFCWPTPLRYSVKAAPPLLPVCPGMSEQELRMQGGYLRHGNWKRLQMKAPLGKQMAKHPQATSTLP